MEHDQAFAAFLVWYASDDKGLFGGFCNLMQLLFDFNVRNHLTRNLAEAAQPVCNFDESVLVDRRDIPGHVPAIMEDFRRLLRLAQISLHHVRTSQEQKHRRAGGYE